MDIICLGLMLCDIIVKPVSKDLFEKDSIPIERVVVLPGGDACNVACNVAAIGLDTAIVSTIGKDANGSYIKQYLESHGVNTMWINESERFGTGTSIVMVEPSGERHFLTNTEIFQNLYPNQLTREMLDGAKILSLNGYYRLPNLDDGGVIPAFKLAHEMGVLTSIDTTWNRQGSWLPRIEETLYYTDLFLPSYNEAVEITGESDVREMRKMLQRYGLKVFAVKMGSKGAYVTDFKDEYFVKPFPVKEVVSTVGAGDSFVAGFLSGQVLGLDMYKSALFANAAASYRVQTVGAVGGMPSAEVLMERISNY